METLKETFKGDSGKIPSKVRGAADPSGAAPNTGGNLSANPRGAGNNRGTAYPSGAAPDRARIRLVDPRGASKERGAADPSGAAPTVARITTADPSGAGSTGQSVSVSANAQYSADLNGAESEKVSKLDGGAYESRTGEVEDAVALGESPVAEDVEDQGRRHSTPGTE